MGAFSVLTGSRARGGVSATQRPLRTAPIQPGSNRFVRTKREIRTMTPMWDFSSFSTHISSGMCGWMLTHADVSTLGAFLYRKVRVGGFPTGETNPNLPSGDSGHLLVV
jgi:hypothetical protein